MQHIDYDKMLRNTTTAHTCKLCSEQFKNESLLLVHLCFWHLSRHLAKLIPDETAPFRCPAASCPKTEIIKYEIVLHYGTDHRKAMELYQKGGPWSVETKAPPNPALLQVRGTQQLSGSAAGGDPEISICKDKGSASASTKASARSAAIFAGDNVPTTCKFCNEKCDNQSSLLFHLCFWHFSRHLAKLIPDESSPFRCPAGNCQKNETIKYAIVHHYGADHKKVIDLYRKYEPWSMKRKSPPSLKMLTDVDTYNKVNEQCEINDTERNTFKEELQRVQDETKKLREQNEIVQTEKLSYKVELEKIQGDSKSLKEEHESLKEQQEITKYEKSNYKEKSESNQKEIKVLKEQHEITMAECMSYKEESQKNRKEYKRLKEEYEVLKTERTNYKDELQRKWEDFENLKEQYEVTKADKNKFDVDADAEKAVIKNEKDNASASVKKELASNSTSSTKNEITEKEFRETNRLRKQVEAIGLEEGATAILDDNSNNVEDEETDNSKFDEDIFFDDDDDETDDVVDEDDEEIKNLEKKLKLAKKKKEMRNKLAEARNLLDKIGARTKELDDLKSQLETKRKESLALLNECEATKEDISQLKRAKMYLSETSVAKLEKYVEKLVLGLKRLEQKRLSDAEMSPPAKRRK